MAFFISEYTKNNLIISDKSINKYYELDERNIKLYIYNESKFVAEYLFDRSLYSGVILRRNFPENYFLKATILNSFASYVDLFSMKDIYGNKYIDKKTDILYIGTYKDIKIPDQKLIDVNGVRSTNIHYFEKDIVVCYGETEKLIASYNRIIETTSLNVIFFIIF